MFYLNWRFTLIALSVAPALALVVYSFTRRIKQARVRSGKRKASCLNSGRGTFLDQGGKSIYQGGLRTAALRTAKRRKRGDGAEGQRGKGETCSDSSSHCRRRHLCRALVWHATGIKWTAVIGVVAGLPVVSGQNVCRMRDCSR